MAGFLDRFQQLTRRLIQGSPNARQVPQSVGEKNRVAEQWFDMGIRNLNYGLFDKAASYFSNVVIVMPDWDEARYHLGRSFLGLRQREKAMEQLEILRDKKSEWADSLDETLTRS